METSIWAGREGGVCARELSLLYLVSWKQASGQGVVEEFVHVSYHCYIWYLGNKHLGRASWRSLCTWVIIVISGILETSIWAGRRGGVCARELSLLYLVSWKQASGQGVVEEFVHVSYHCYIWYLGNKHLGRASWRSLCTWVIIVISGILETSIWAGRRGGVCARELSLLYLVSWKQASGRGVVEEFVHVSYHCYIWYLGNKHLGGASWRSLWTWVIIVISGILETSIWAGRRGGVCARELSLLYLVSWKQASGRGVVEEFVQVSYNCHIWYLGNKHLGRASWRSLCTRVIIVISGILETSIWAGQQENFVHLSYHSVISGILETTIWALCARKLSLLYLESWKLASGRGVVEEFVHVSYYCYIWYLGNKHLGGASWRSLCTWVIIVISAILESSNWAGRRGGVCARELLLLYLVSWKQASGQSVVEEFVHVTSDKY